ncbi:T9SS type A sorting domain-containing protein [Polaribacter atrinae]|uniref:T9SS type A sorting domain-containing protein n=1 Tax=Polaribacter atrinae TaxID=1333662 RepID=UPI00249194B0|nr:T9SS type A sorting domain-containing protein [Polaribacter atrinae]
MRTSGSSDDFIAGKGTKPNSALAKIKLTKGNKNFNTSIYFIENQTKGLDASYDASAYKGNAAGIYTNLVEGNTGVEFAIQTLDYTDFNNVVVPLGIKASSGEQFTVSLNDVFTTLPTGINVYLEDNITGKFTDLNTSDFVLTATEDLNDTGRFFIHFTSKALSNDVFNTTSIQVYADNISKTLFIKGMLNQATKLAIYDIQGRVVLKQVLSKNSTINSIKTNSLNTGVYIIKLGNDLQSKTQKVIIK